MAKIGRNEKCPCGSGRKYKKCCINANKRGFQRIRSEQVPPEVLAAFEQHKAKELTRAQQQGLGNPIVSFESNGYRLVAVGNVVHWSKNWKTFHDFLLTYIKKVMGGEWGNSEIAKPYEKRHPILQWYHQVCAYQAKTIQEPGQVSSAPIIGVVEAYLRLAYNLYLLGHNTIKNEYSEKLQKRLIKRLKDRDNFPGAYYETFVSAILIRAGYEVEPTDEVGGGEKLCDFTITNKISGQQYNVEAKAINRSGALGAQQNTTQADLRQNVRDQLYKALRKPTSLPRIIFIELNLPDIVTKQDKKWIDEAVAAVHEAETMTINKKPSEPTYVFITNHPHHYHPDQANALAVMVPVGYKIPDFGYGKKYTRLRDLYYAKKKHGDVNGIIESVKACPELPVTFDGSLPSETFGGYQRPIIGQTYHFTDAGGEDGLVATVTTATVNKQDKEVVIGTDKGILLKGPISDEALLDFERHPDTFFGVMHRQGRHTEDPYELFENILESYLNTPREKLLEFMKDRPDIEELKPLTQKELAVIYAEGIVNAVVNKQSQKAEQVL